MKLLPTQLLVFATLLAAGLAFAADEAADINRLQGDWQRVSMEIDGTSVANDAAPVRIRGDRIVLLQEGKELAEPQLKLKLEMGADPKLLDILLPDGGTLEGIYKLEDRRWTLCLRTDANVKDRPTAFETKSGSKLILVVLEKVQ